MATLQTGQTAQTDLSSTRKLTRAERRRLARENAKRNSEAQALLRKVQFRQAADAAAKQKQADRAEAAETTEAATTPTPDAKPQTVLGELREITKTAIKGAALTEFPTVDNAPKYVLAGGFSRKAKEQFLAGDDPRFDARYDPRFGPGSSTELLKPPIDKRALDITPELDLTDVPWPVRFYSMRDMAATDRADAEFDLADAFEEESRRREFQDIARDAAPDTNTYQAPRHRTATNIKTLGLAAGWQYIPGDNAEEFKLPVRFEQIHDRFIVIYSYRTHVKDPEGRCIPPRSRIAVRDQNSKLRWSAPQTAMCLGGEPDCGYTWLHEGAFILTGLEPQQPHMITVYDWYPISGERTYLPGRAMGRVKLPWDEAAARHLADAA